MPVLVVCRANVARSPLAEVMLADALAPLGVEVSSAGIQAVTGSPPARGSVELAAERGLDLTAHRSRPVTPELLAGADLVLTMSENQRDTCSRLVAGAGRYTFTLRELDRLAAHADTPARPPGGVPPGAAGTAGLIEAAHLARPAARPPRGREDIPDPIGLDWEHWLTLAEELDDVVARLAARLRAAPRPD